MVCTQFLCNTEWNSVWVPRRTVREMNKFTRRKMKGKKEFTWIKNDTTSHLPLAAPRHYLSFFFFLQISFTYLFFLQVITHLPQGRFLPNTGCTSVQQHFELNADVWQQQLISAKHIFGWRKSFYFFFPLKLSAKKKKAIRRMEGVKVENLVCGYIYFNDNLTVGAAFYGQFYRQCERWTVRWRRRRAENKQQSHSIPPPSCLNSVLCFSSGPDEFCLFSFSFGGKNLRQGFQEKPAEKLAPRSQCLW